MDLKIKKIDFGLLGEPTSDGQFIVATGPSAFQFESGDVARTSLGLGTGDSPTWVEATFSGLTATSVPFIGIGGVLADDVNKLSFIRNASYNGLFVGSPDDSKWASFQCKNTAAKIQWNIGGLYLQTDQGVNSNTYIYVQGKGTGYGTLRLYDQDNAEYASFGCTSGNADFLCAGTNPIAMRLQDNADCNIKMFGSSASGETKGLYIYGYKSGDIKRALSITVGGTANDTVDFTGLGSYKFGGTVGIGVAEQINLYHTGTHAYITTTKGNIRLQTANIVDKNTYFGINGNGSPGIGYLSLYDQDQAESMQFRCSLGHGYIQMVGVTPGPIHLQDGATSDVRCFANSAEGETKELRIYGRRTGDIRRQISIGTGIHAADTGSFSNCSNYYFDGNVGIGVIDPHSQLEVAGAISSATSTFSTVGPTDDVDVSGINTLFLDTSGNSITIGGFAGGVDGQVLYVLRISNANNAIIEHNEAEATQKIFLHAGADETLGAEYGGWIFVCHGGIDWHDCSHAKHVP